jgi:four helix bundle protein
LPENWVGKHLRNQLFRSATSVAANYRSACSAQSIKAFLQKLGIVVEEIDESMFWIEFIAEQELVGNKRCQPFLSHRRKRRVEKMEN